MCNNSNRQLSREANKSCPGSGLALWSCRTAAAAVAAVRGPWPSIASLFPRSSLAIAQSARTTCVRERHRGKKSGRASNTVGCGYVEWVPLWAVDSRIGPLGCSFPFPFALPWVSVGRIARSTCSTTHALPSNTPTHPKKVPSHLSIHSPDPHLPPCRHTLYHGCACCLLLLLLLPSQCCCCCTTHTCTLMAQSSPLSGVARVSPPKPALSLK